MSRRFLALRLSTMTWGFVVSYAFTGSLIAAVPMWVVLVGGNTVLMWWFAR